MLSELNISEIISIRSDDANRQLVFAGTSIPIESFFSSVKQGISLDKYLEYFPAVSREKAIKLLEEVNR